MKIKDKKPRNSKGKRHGYRERYWPNGLLISKGYYTNGKKSGIWEWYSYINGELNVKKYYIL